MAFLLNGTNNQIFNVVVVGDECTGKTSLISRLTSGKFPRSYIPTKIFEEEFMVIPTSHGIKLFIRLWDTSSDHRSIIPNIEFICADAIIFLYDSSLTLESIVSRYQNITQICGEEIPIVIVRNKIDLSQSNQKIDLSRGIFKNVEHFEISAKCCYKYQEPLLHLVRQWTNIPNLQFIEEDEKYYKDPFSFLSEEEGNQILYSKL